MKPFVSACSIFKIDIDIVLYGWLNELVSVIAGAEIDIKKYLLCNAELVGCYIDEFRIVLWYITIKGLFW